MSWGKKLGDMRQCKRALTSTACLPLQICLASLTSDSSDCMVTSCKAGFNQFHTSVNLHFYQTLTARVQAPAPEIL